MNTAILNHTPTLSFGGVSKTYKRLVKAVRTELEMRTAIAELNSLDTRCLNDMGIARHEIARIVRGL